MEYSATMKRIDHNIWCSGKSSIQNINYIAISFLCEKYIKSMLVLYMENTLAILNSFDRQWLFLQDRTTEDLSVLHTFLYLDSFYKNYNFL